MLRIAFYCFICFIFSSALFGQKVVELDDEMKEFVVSGVYLKLYEDNGKTKTISDVSKPSFDSQFVQNQSSYPYNEHTQSAYWVKFKIKNNSKSGKSFLLESYAPHTNNWQVYIPTSNGYVLKQSGQDLYFYDREYINKNLILDLPVGHGEELTYYVRVLSNNHSSFDFRIKPSRYFFFYSTNEYFFLGLYYGILLIMAVYNLLMFVALRQKIYFYYVLYVFAGILTTLADDGIGYQYLWTNFPKINDLMGPHIAPTLLLVTFVFYSFEFLSLKKKMPAFYNVILISAGLYLVYFALKLTILPIAWHSHIFYLIPFLLIFIAAVKCVSNGDKAARFFILGYTFVLLSIIIIKLRSNGTIEGTLFTVYSLNYGLVLEVLILSFALSERLRYSKKKQEKILRQRNEAQYKAIRQLRINESLKDKVTRELETKVAERTKELHEKNMELEQANQRLQEISEATTQMNLKLDIDNWNLQKKVLDAIRARMVGQEVSKEEFQKIFPDDKACLRYLYELKWENGFICKKCGHREATDEAKLFTKKCVHCGYVESATANTLFHGIKFPIHKAFHIVYLTIHSDKTLDELSEMLELRRNTCWSFKQKVLEAIEAYQKKNKTKVIKSWENILL